MAVVEAALSDLRAESRRDHDQRDREHRENQVVLTRIETTQQRMEHKFDVTSEAMHVLGTDHRKLREDVDDLVEWRKGLLDQIRGIVRIPKVVLALTPVGMLILGILTVFHPQ